MANIEKINLIRGGYSPDSLTFIVKTGDQPDRTYIYRPTVGFDSGLPAPDALCALPMSRVVRAYKAEIIGRVRKSGVSRFEDWRTVAILRGAQRTLLEIKRHSH